LKAVRMSASTFFYCLWSSDNGWRVCRTDSDICEGFVTLGRHT
jgi:hypothetical protein